MSEKYKSLKVKELQELLQKNGIPYSGKKEDLIERLVKNDERKALEKLEKEFELDDDFDESKLNVDLTPIVLDKPIIHEKESVLSDDDDDDFLAITAPIKVPEPVKKVEVAKVGVEEKMKDVVSAPATTAAPVTASTSASSFKFTPITYESKTTTATATVKETTKTTTTTTKAPTSKPTTEATVIKTTTATTTIAKKKTVAEVKDNTKATQDLAERYRLEAERKLERSKRFGIKLDEKDMKAIRAARFGIIGKPEEPAKKENKKVEEKKESAQEILKKRAERFGIPELKIKPVAKNTKTTQAAKKTTPTKAKQVAKSAPVNQKAQANQKVIKKVNKNDFTKVKQGRVQKPAVKSKPVNRNNNATKKVTLNHVTKNNVLDKKQNNVNKKLGEKVIAQTKKNIVNNRLNNLGQQRKSRRMAGFTPKPIAQQQQQLIKSHLHPNSRNINTQAPESVDPIKYGRKIIINTPPVITPNPNTTISKHRKRGRGPESNHYIKDKKRRN